MFIFLSRTSSFAQEHYQYNANAERSFATGLLSFQEGNFSKAAEVFDQLIKLKPIHQRTTASYIMLSKSRFQLKEYAVSSAVAWELLNAFPPTSYRADVYYILGLSAMMQQRYEEALRSFLSVRASAKDSLLVEEAMKYFELVASDRVTILSLTKLRNENSDRFEKDLLTLKLAERYYGIGDGVKAKEMLALISRDNHDGSFSRRVQKIAQHLIEKGSLKIGVLLPLISASSADPVSTITNEVLDGIQYALEDYISNNRSGVSISLEVKNINGDVSSVEQVKALTLSDDVIGIVGPLFSNHAFTYAPVAEAERIPMISPTANANGIAAKSRYVFQTNPDVSTRGKAMAQYAVRTLGFTKLAVITSDNQQSRILADEFIQEAKRLGAIIVAYESYNKDSTDLREQFMRIREAGATDEPSISFTKTFTRIQLRNMIRAGADPVLLDEVRRKKETILATKLFGPRGKHIADSLHLPVVNSLGETFNIEIPVTGVQGIFVAITESEDIGVIAPQMSYFNIKAQLLGSGEWNDQSQLEANKRYVDGVLFLSDSYIDKLYPQYAAFEQSFIRVKKRLPTRNTLFGYDTMKLLLTQFEHGVTTREQLAIALANIKDYKGVHGTISLHHGRVNSNVYILKFQNNNINIVTEINVE